MTGNPVPQSAPLPFGGAAFITTRDAAQFLGVCVRSVAYMVEDGKLRKVYPRPRAARITAESVVAYRSAIEAGELPKVWTQPGNPHAKVEETPAPVPKRLGLLGRWGLGSD